LGIKKNYRYGLKIQGLLLPAQLKSLKQREIKLVVKTEDTQRDETILRKRSVLISGHQTSISIEDAFWIELKSICKRETKSLNQIATEVDERRSGNLSSALRVFILNYKAQDRLT
jgi:predicted DNA-binding ribbon-helix-helix protein